MVKPRLYNAEFEADTQESQDDRHEIYRTILKLFETMADKGYNTHELEAVIVHEVVSAGAYYRILRNSKLRKAKKNLLDD